VYGFCFLHTQICGAVRKFRTVEKRMIMVGYIFCIMISFTAGFLMSAMLGSMDQEDDEK